MAYNYASAFAPALPRPKFFPPFQGPVIGFDSKGFYKPSDEAKKKVAQPPKIEIVSNPINAGKTNLMLLKLRTRWLDAFLAQVLALNPAIPRDVATTWVDFHMPKTADELAMSMTFGECEKLAFRLADAWDAA